MKPANLLFFLCDERNPRVLGCAGHPMIRTPALAIATVATSRADRNWYIASPKTT
jgi:choline-sulfatase